MSMSNLDGFQVLKSAHDDTNAALKIRMLGSAVDVSWDYMALALSGGNTIETYTFKTGGSGGTTVRTVAITYTDSGRGTISSVTKS